MDETPPLDEQLELLKAWGWTFEGSVKKNGWLTATYAPPTPSPEERSAATGCPACSGTGLTGQDDQPGVVFPATVCLTCWGTGKVN